MVKTELTSKRAVTGMVVMVVVFFVYVLFPRGSSQGQASGGVEARGAAAVSGAGQAATSLPTVEFAAEPDVVQIDPPSAVAEASTPVNDDDPDAWNKKTGRVKITQDTLDRITGGEESLVAVPLFDGEVIQVQLEERQPLGTAGMLVYGKVQGEPNSRVHFSIFKHAMVASFALEDGREFKIGSLPQGKHEYQLAEIDTVALIRHQKFPGVPGRVHVGFVDGEKVTALPSYVVGVPKSQMPLRKMLGAEAWDPEMKVVAAAPGQDGLSGRIKLRQPYGESAQRDEDRTSGEGDKAPAGLITPSPQQVTPAGGWVINRSGQWMNKPVYKGGGASSGGMGIGFWYTPKVETLFGDSSKVAAEAGTRIAAANQSNKDSGLSFTYAMAGNVYKIAKEFDGTQIYPSLDYITPWKNGDPAVNKVLNAQRDSSKADLVTLMIDGTRTAGVAGLAWKLTSIKGKDTQAYNSIVHKSVPTNVSWDHKTWAHEAGHNMGLGHDAAQGAKGILANSWGNHFMAGGKGYHSIMAYPKAPYTNTALVWAGPNVDYNGSKSGSAAADAVGTLKQTSGPIMGYR